MGQKSPVSNRREIRNSTGVLDVKQTAVRPHFGHSGVRYAATRYIPKRGLKLTSKFQPASISELFALQDGVVAQNRAAASAEFASIERGLLVGLQVTMFLNEGSALVARRAKADAAARSENICINLIHSAWSSLVDATRLVLWGAYVDGMALVRNGLEATFLCEYFFDHPADAVGWDQIGSILDVLDIQKALQQFENAKHPKRAIQLKYAADDSVKRLFAELSTYGTHANPKTVNLRLSSPIQGVANLGFVGTGRIEATRLGALRVLHTLRYVISLTTDYLSPYLALDPVIRRDIGDFISGADLVMAKAPATLSLSK